MSETITISKAEYIRLRRNNNLLEALRVLGVDNWDGWDESNVFCRDADEALDNELGINQSTD